MKILDSEWPRNETRRPASRGWLLTTVGRHGNVPDLTIATHGGKQKSSGRISAHADSLDSNTTGLSAWMADCWRPDNDEG